MVNAKRRSRWGRAWVAVGLACAVMCLPVVSAAQSNSTGDQSRTAPTAPSATPGPEPSEIAPPPAAASAPAPSQDQDATQPQQDGAPAPDASSGEADQNAAPQPMAKNLETGLPLRSVMSPLHWGHLSLLSFEGFEAYNNNQPQLSPLGREFTALEGLFIYSIQKSRSALNLQYSPYVWFSQNTTYKDFTANAANLETSHIFNRRWSLSASDDFQYSPNLANTLHSAFAADFVSNTSSQTPFMSVGRKSLFNNAEVTVNTQLSATSRLSFSAVDDFVHLGAYVGSPSTTSAVPDISERLNSYGGGVNWSRQWNSRNTIHLSYNYRRQTVSGIPYQTSFNSASVGFSRMLKPTLTLAVDVGPGWNTPPRRNNEVQSPTRTTVQGSVQLFKAFRNGGIAASFYRNSEFSGLISNSYNNRYDLAFNHRLFTRLNFMINGSYIQQEFIGSRRSTGELGWAELGYMLSRNWSAFAGYRYLRMSGNLATLLGQQQLADVGIRWAWQPESAHK